MQRPSFLRITGWTLFLSAALFLGFAFKHLETFTNTNHFRPRVVTLLESTFRCKVQLGNARLEWFPHPGLIISQVVLMEPSSTPHILASARSIHIWIQTKALLKGHLEVRTIRFSYPRIRLHRERQKGKERWVLLSLPQSHSSGGTKVDQIEIRNGSLEIWDHTMHPMRKWVVDKLSGSLDMSQNTGVIAGHAFDLGPDNLIRIRYTPIATFPIETQVTHVELASLQALLHQHIPGLAGSAACKVKIRFQPSLEIHATLDPLLLTRMHGTPIRATGSFQEGHLHMHLQSDTTSSFTMDAEGTFPANMKKQSAFLTLHQTSAGGESVQIHWNQPAGSSDSFLRLHAHALTVGQILGVFADTGPAHGYDAWPITEGTIQTVIHPNSIEVKPSSADVAGMHADFSGACDLKGKNRLARINGQLQNVPVESVLNSFFKPPAPLTGTGQMTFALIFPASNRWLEGLNGPMQLEIKKGVLRVMKDMYRVVSVLNLSNYLSFRLPKIKAQGIVFQNLSGHLTFQNGVLSSNDLFLKSPDMNLGANGSVNLPGESVHATIRLELFHFIEDLLRDVPLTHWLFHKKNKILVPLVVTIKGPWKDVDIY